MFPQSQLNALSADTLYGCNIKVNIFEIQELREVRLVIPSPDRIDAYRRRLGKNIERLAALLAWWLFAESPTEVQAVGGAVMLVGIVLARKGSR